MVELTDLGRPEELQAAEGFLRAALQLRDEDALAIPSVPPAGWQEIVIRRDQRALVQDLKTRHIQALLRSAWAFPGPPAEPGSGEAGPTRHVTMGDLPSAEQWMPAGRSS